MMFKGFMVIAGIPWGMFLPDISSRMTSDTKIAE